MSVASPRLTFHRLLTAMAVARLLTIYWSFALLKHFLPLAMLTKLAWRRSSTNHDRDLEHVAIARVKRTAQLAGSLDRDCLQRSLLLYRELSRAGAEPILVVGFQRVDGKPRGHAWVTAADRIVGDAADHVAQFESICRFGAGGCLIDATPRCQIG